MYVCMYKYIYIYIYASMQCRHEFGVSRLCSRWSFDLVQPAGATENGALLSRYQHRVGFFTIIFISVVDCC